MLLDSEFTDPRPDEQGVGPVDPALRRLYSRCAALEKGVETLEARTNLLLEIVHAQGDTMVNLSELLGQLLKQDQLHEQQVVAITETLETLAKGMQMDVLSKLPDASFGPRQ